MVEIEFNYLQQILILQANLNETFRTMAEIYSSEAQLNLNDLGFLSNGQLIDIEEIINNIISNVERQLNRMSILVINMRSTRRTNNNNINNNNRNNNNINNNINNNNIIQSPEVICPICKEPCYLKVEDYKISLYGCKQGHKQDNLKLDEFVNSQKIDLTSIICGYCKKRNRAEINNKEFYKCCQCNMNLCPFCKFIHDKNHDIINYDLRNYVCNKHNKIYKKFCVTCQIFLCSSCEKEHEFHIESIQNCTSRCENDKKLLRELRKELNKFNENINEIINKLNIVMKNFETYYNIYNSILLFLENNNIMNSYQSSNLGNYYNSVLLELDKIRQEYDYGNNINKLLYMSNEIEDKNISIDMEYVPVKNNNMNNRIRIFGKAFVDNNKDKIKIIFYSNFFGKELEYELKEFWDIDPYYKYPAPFKFKLKGINNITDASDMFSGCNLLFSLPDISKLNTSKITKMAGIFHRCTSLLSLPDISKWDTSNVEDMNFMFHDCEKLLSLPDISKWDTFNVCNMKGLFNSCISLKSLPDISKWNTSNVEDMSYMFNQCRSLISLPDLSKWNTENLQVHNYMFYMCNNFLNIPYKFK